MPFPSTQQERVIAFNGPKLVVVAAPGTGKSQTIVQRMIRLLSEDPNRVVSFLTFTRASRRETYERVERALGAKAVETVVSDLPRISTLHTFAKSLVHRYAAAIDRDSDFSILVTGRGERQIIISDVVEDLGLLTPVEELEKAIVCYGCTEEWPPETHLTSAQRTAVTELYERLLAFYDTFDMEGIVSAACKILSDPSVVPPAVFLQVDEFQDLNPTDQKFVMLASQKAGSQVVVVGDDAQSIYRYRFANPKAMSDLWNSSDWETECLTECHRLPPHVLRATQALIKDAGYLGASVEVPPDNGMKILTLQTTQNQQIRAVASHIEQRRREAESAGEAIPSYGSFMVLCPFKAQVEEFATTLEGRHGIPTRVQQQRSIPDSVWSLILVLRLIDSDSLALRQWLSVIGISPAAIAAIRTTALGAGEKFYEHCAALKQPALVSLFESIDALRTVLIDPEEFGQAILNFPGLEVDAEVVSTVSIIAPYCPAIGRMIGKIYEEYGVLEHDEDESSTPETDAVLVATMHRSKGLEKDFVYVTWLDNRFMPGPGRNIEEEKRVLYVAMTRAKKDLVFTFQERYEKGRYYYHQAMSPFLNSILPHLDVRRMTAKDFKTSARAP